MALTAFAYGLDADSEGTPAYPASGPTAGFQACAGDGLVGVASSVLTGATAFPATGSSGSMAESAPFTVLASSTGSTTGVGFVPYGVGWRWISFLLVLLS